MRFRRKANGSGAQDVEARERMTKNHDLGDWQGLGARAGRWLWLWLLAGGTISRKIYYCRDGACKLELEVELELELEHSGLR